MRDWTGVAAGALSVLGPDEEQPRKWRIRWGCCGREGTVSVEYISSRTRTQPNRCRACVVGADPDVSIAEYARATREKKENGSGEKIYAAGLWYGPELGAMGRR